MREVGIYFHCSFHNNTYELCNGGKCMFRLNQTNRETCEKCPLGWGPTVTGFILSDCYQPNLLLPIWFASYTFLAILTFIFIYRKMKILSSKSLIAVCKSYLIFIVSENLFVFSMFLENGRYLFANLFAALATYLGFRFISGIVILLLFTGWPVLRMREKEFIRRRVFMLEFSFTLVNFLVSLMVGVFNGYQVDKTHIGNSFLALFLLLLLLQSCIFFFGILMLVSRLKRKLEEISRKHQNRIIHDEEERNVHTHRRSITSQNSSSNNSEFIQRSIVRIKAVRGLSLQLIASLILFNLCQVLVVGIIGNFPYVWVLNVIMSTNVMLTPNVLKFMEIIREDAPNDLLDATNRFVSSYRPIPTIELLKLSTDYSIDDLNEKITFEQAEKEGFKWTRWKNDFEKEKKIFLREYQEWKEMQQILHNKQRVKRQQEDMFNDGLSEHALSDWKTMTDEAEKED